MEYVKTRLEVRSVKWKVEKRVLKRIGHVFRMRNDRLTKVIVLGWWEELERWEKRPKKKKEDNFALKEDIKGGRDRLYRC